MPKMQEDEKEHTAVNGMSRMLVSIALCNTTMKPKVMHRYPCCYPFAPLTCLSVSTSITPTLASRFGKDDKQLTHPPNPSGADNMIKFILVQVSPARNPSSQISCLHSLPIRTDKERRDSRNGTCHTKTTKRYPQALLPVPATRADRVSFFVLDRLD